MTMMDSQKLALRRDRGRLAVILVMATLGILAGAFFRLQIVSGDQYVLRSEENRFRAITMPAPRGTIYDRNGLVIAENVPGYVISILPGPRDTMAATIDRLASQLDISPEERERLLLRNRQRPNEPLVVRDNAGFEQVTFVEERRPQFRRVVVESRPRRQYPMGPANAHFIGYVGEISEQELLDEKWDGYEPGRIVGKSGLELQYEATLAGAPGVRYVEVNALGSIVRDFDVGRGREAIPGQDLHLGIDLDLQALARQTFPDTMRGGVVALDLATGEVLTFYSHPTFDPNEFVGGIPFELWNTLQSDPGQPMFNRVSTASYPPGSTWKLVMSTVGMRTGALSIGTFMGNACRGGLTYGNRFFRCWYSAGHGPEDLAGAIKGSCNVYFYQAGDRIGLDALLATVSELGFGERTGVDLPFEIDGKFPESRAWFDARYGRRGWTESVVWNLAIGQGENSQSLLRMASFYAALATGETPIAPHLKRDENLASRRMEWSLGIPDASRLELVEAMRTVVNEPRGTAYSYRIDDWQIAGKTGTSQNTLGAPHSWFVGFAPAHDPKIVIAAIVEQGHPDGTVSLAVPYAAGIIERHLRNIGLPPDPTLPRVASGADDGVTTGG
ncbi:MAG: penicillin-binding protein 2 [Gemmatimonadota bacterium]|nr:penicillin-binding protein 2 [Gemmatimonadota bacterium]